MFVVLQNYEALIEHQQQEHEAADAELDQTEIQELDKLTQVTSNVCLLTLLMLENFLRGKICRLIAIGL